MGTGVAYGSGGRHLLQVPEMIYALLDVLFIALMVEIGVVFALLVLMAAAELRRDGP